MDVVVLEACKKELESFPEETRSEVIDCIARLRLGQHLTMPLSRTMPSLGKGVHELRLKDKSGQYRVIYWVKIKDGIYLVHAFKKTSQQTSLKNLQTALLRMKRL